MRAMNKRSRISFVGFLLSAFILAKETVYAQYGPKAAGQWYSPSYGRHWQGQQSNYNQNAARPNYKYASAAPRNYGYNANANVAVAPVEQSSNHTVGYYEACAHTEHGRRLGRMLDVYSGRGGDIGSAIDQVAERFQNLLREAQKNQVQPMPSAARYNQNEQGQNAYSKAAWSGGYSKKPWVPYAEYMASRQAGGASWSPNAGYTAAKKSWSPWSKSKWSPAANEGGYSQKSWSPNPAYSKKPWSPYQNSWSPNPGYSKKPWSPYSAAAQYNPKWGAGYSRQPWQPTNNPQYGQPETVANSVAAVESPGMDVNDFAMDADVAVETETRSKRTRKEKTTREVDAEHLTEAAVNTVDDVMDDLELHDAGTSHAKSAETAHMGVDITEPGDISIEK